MDPFLKEIITPTCESDLIREKRSERFKGIPDDFLFIALL